MTKLSINSKSREYDLNQQANQTEWKTKCFRPENTNTFQLEF